jgi:hypothetical protein
MRNYQMLIALDYFLALLPQESEEFLNGVFFGPKVSSKIFEVMNGHGGLVGE